MSLDIVIRHTTITVTLSDEQVVEMKKRNACVTASYINQGLPEGHVRGGLVIVRRIDEGLYPRYVFQTESRKYDVVRVPGLPILYDLDSVTIEVLGLKVTVMPDSLKELAETGQTYVEIDDGEDLLHIKHVEGGYGFHTYHHGSTIELSVKGLPDRRQG